MPGQSISRVMEDTSKFTPRELNKLLKSQGCFWQNGFHNHRCRNESEVHELASHIEHNPVRKGLVNSAEQWPYSSAYLDNKYLLDRDWWP
jgi:REP element-mobilizing transposase RayT